MASFRPIRNPCGPAALFATVCAIALMIACEPKRQASVDASLTDSASARTDRSSAPTRPEIPIRQRVPAPFDSPPGQVDFGRMQLEVAFTPADFDAHTMNAVVTHNIRPHSSGLTSLELDAIDLTIKSIEIGPDWTPASFSQADGKLRIALPATRRDTAEFPVKIAYQATKPRLGLHFSGNDEEFTVYTNAEPLQARYWLPCHDWPDTRWQGCDVTIETPGDFNVVAVGKPVAAPRAIAGGQRLSHRWALDTPIDPHIFGFVVGRFREVCANPGSAGVPVLLYMQPKYLDAEAAEDWPGLFAEFDDVPKSITFYERLLGFDYPYPQFAHVSVPGHFHGGMEHAGFDMLAPSMFVQMRGSERLRYDYITHMIAHAWFAGLTNYAHITEAWLNEGFATYLHILWKGEREGIEAFRREMSASRGRVARFDIVGKSHPLVNTEIPEPGAIYSFGAGAVYFKGAWALHMLRRELGDEIFWHAVHEFLKTNRGRGVVTSDLQRAFQQASDRDLNAFFDQWVYRDGTPRLEIRYEWLPERRVLAIDVAQDQLIDADHPPFKMPLDVRVTLGGLSLDQRLDLAQATQHFELECADRPETVRFDPDVWALALIRIDSPSTTKPAEP